MNILILDDQQARHDIVESNFTRAGHVVLHAFNPQEAIDIIIGFAQPIGLAMLDHDLNCFVSEAGVIVPFEYEGKKVELDGKYFVRTMIYDVPKDKWPAFFVIHSHNEDGTKAMASLLRQADAHGFIRRFSPNMVQQLILELSKN